MPPVVVDFDRLAAQEYTLARRRYARNSPTVAESFRGAVADAIRRIETSPFQRTPFRSRYRWRRVPRFPYTLYYLPLNPSHVLILAVAHTSRRPGYWLRRSPP